MLLHLLQVPPPPQVPSTRLSIFETDLEGEDEDEVCVICGGSPCEWTEFGPAVEAEIQVLHLREFRVGQEVIVDKDGNLVSNNVMRKTLYKKFIYIKYGHLGKGNRIPIVSCVTKKIRELFPEIDDNKYVGFHSEDNKTVT